MITPQNLRILSAFLSFLFLESNVVSHPPSFRPPSRHLRYSSTTKPSKTPATPPSKTPATPPSKTPVTPLSKTPVTPLSNAQPSPSKHPTLSYPSELLRRRSAARLPPAQPTLSASSPQEWVEQLRRNRALKRCYERNHRRFRDVRLQNVVPLRLVISAKGRVVRVRVGTITGKQHPIGASLERCLLRALRWAHFRTGGRTATLIYPVASDASH